MKSIVWTSESVASAIAARVAPAEIVVIRSIEEFFAAPRDARTVSFLDDSTIEMLERYATSLAQPTAVPSPEWRRLIAAVSIGSVIAVCEARKPASRWLQSQPWLSHVVSTSSLRSPTYLVEVMNALESRELPKLLDWIDASIEGRRIRLTHASRCASRVERMTEFFASRHASPMVVDQVRDVVRELLVHAFYNAPLDAGALNEIDENQDVALPDENACDLAYGWHGDHAVIRVLDPFGSLTRQKLVDSLARYSNGVQSTGLSRTFSVAFLAVAVLQHRHTEFLVGIGEPGVESFAFHLFFKDSSKRVSWRLADESTGHPASGGSITIIPTE
jgi:hypothetical protein